MNGPEVSLAPRAPTSSSELPNTRLGYRPALDGLRGVSILIVMAAHANLIGFPFGFVGVDIFFVLSGFLITCLLVEEWLRYGCINLNAFYIRRVLRLLPALMLLVLFLIGLHLIVPSWRRYAWSMTLDGFRRVMLRFQLAAHFESIPRNPFGPYLGHFPSKNSFT